MNSGINAQTFKTISRLVLLTLAFQITLFGAAMAYEEPKYELIKSTAIYEIRKYGDRLAVQTIQNSGEDRAFGRLFSYISGANLNSNKISMTTPVIQSSDGSGMVMNFFLPSKYSEKTAPIPESKNVSLVTIRGGYYAVIKYSGRSTESNFNKHVAILKEALDKDGIKAFKHAIKATYNGPLTPFFLRRNEAMYRVKWE